MQPKNEFVNQLSRVSTVSAQDVAIIKSTTNTIIRYENERKLTNDLRTSSSLMLVFDVLYNEKTTLTNRYKQHDRHQGSCEGIDRCGVCSHLQTNLIVVQVAKLINR